ncbi:UDP-N-acetylmuramyl pentapeptide phosphotransferase/UDP-N-acetylglucosamine-1-phosphate transferase [Keratinibaculum paraultunense]|uniref:UDP-N-acetylmuramyl pentapeptide phosphotransferase/UDP-N-acetylglucosamine-1-phosphate transferase n=1 Tax=Keratinibaculum paraultunense TaxID=1278232 RepID=A0A4R3L2C1_9FIRM|nr:phospho-N-acetylmuramoyl-pentapeptide-transferase [Keratinibaculum paraultunense]QQY80629.1 phospho-N-acetylmuramoyl-pentapeptide-transferase [Keratinibaculum paraultunense]TCS91361.1 UDP-N-acetylmuramyl pentapeptide phosphotransferase/UDP-N-acetylglucosamine-1-phosphate transferase [Keratinibaculum paraultunense]
MKNVNILSFIVSLILSYIAVPMIKDMLFRNKIVSLNYNNEEIPLGMGILFIFVQVISISLTSILGWADIKVAMGYLLACTLMGFVGLIDDLVGETDIKGFRGHINAFFKGKLTTGLLKAGIGFFIALFISIIFSSTLLDIVINTLIIALFTNLTNLLDLRPGRSIKVFLLISVIMLFTNITDEYNFILYSIYGILFIYFPIDLKAKAMMGDVGSNFIGITLGIYCIFTQTLLARSIYLFILILIHILAEKISFTKVIEKNKFLSFLDNLGR